VGSGFIAVLGKKSKRFDLFAQLFAQGHFSDELAYFVRCQLWLGVCSCWLAVVTLLQGFVGGLCNSECWPSRVHSVAHHKGKVTVRA
jgi:hypothetical protein